MEKIRNLVYVVAVVFGFAVLSGIFGWKLSGGVEALLSLITISAVIWLVVLVSKKHKK